MSPPGLPQGEYRGARMQASRRAGPARSRRCPWRRRCWVSRRCGTPTRRRCTGATSRAACCTAGTPASATHGTWALASEPGCIAPLPGGALLLAMRDGLWRFSPASGQRRRLAPPPYDPTQERFNDGKADPQGRLWVGTIYEPRTAAEAALYRWSEGRLQRMAGDVTVSNGLAFSPDGRTMYWSDTTAHRIYALDFDGSDGSAVAPARLRRVPGQGARAVDLADYGGRPDGAAVDAEGAYWVAMYEGQRLLRLSPDGELLPRGAAAGALPDHAVLRRRRPAHAVHHHRARPAARPTNWRRSRWPAAC